MISKHYKTKQRNTLLDFFKENSNTCFTAKELIKNPAINLGEATVYRTLARFVAEGSLKKYISSPAEGAYYQYNDECEECKSHFHLKCTGCGTLFHMDCDFMNEMKKHIEQSHSFVVDNSQTTLYGRCSNCMTK